VGHLVAPRGNATLLQTSIARVPERNDWCLWPRCTGHAYPGHVYAVIRASTQCTAALVAKSEINGVPHTVGLIAVQCYLPHTFVRALCAHGICKLIAAFTGIRMLRVASRALNARSSSWLAPRDRFRAVSCARNATVTERLLPATSMPEVKEHSSFANFAEIRITHADYGA
jgi:hypothetical protein